MFGKGSCFGWGCSSLLLAVGFCISRCPVRNLGVSAICSFIRLLNF